MQNDLVYKPVAKRRLISVAILTAALFVVLSLAMLYHRKLVFYFIVYTVFARITTARLKRNYLYKTKTERLNAFESGLKAGGYSPETFYTSINSEMNRFYHDTVRDGKHVVDFDIMDFDDLQTEGSGTNFGANLCITVREVTLNSRNHLSRRMCRYNLKIKSTGLACEYNERADAEKSAGSLCFGGRQAPFPVFKMISITSSKR